MNLITLLSSFDGRINRAQYWLGWIVLLIVFALVGLAVRGPEAFDGPYSGLSAFTLIFTGMLTVASLPLMVKRLHDRNKSGHYVWPLCIMEAVSVGGDFTGITGDTADMNTLGWAVFAVYCVIALWMIVELGFLSGTDGDNDHGPDPLAARGTAEKAAA